ncbi:unnamed protein product [Arabidopsis lyrata]|nr:unnamed protein product [Arabidopsis lyrata]
MGNEKFTWVIKNFSSLGSKSVSSDEFVFGGCKWFLMGYQNANYLALFLVVAGFKTLHGGWNRLINYRLTVVNQVSEKLSQQRGQTQCWLDRKNFLHGYQEMISLTKLNAKEGGFLVKNEVKIVAEVYVLQVIGNLDVLEGSQDVTKPLKRIRLNDDGAASSHLQTMDVNGFQVLPSQCGCRIYTLKPESPSFDERRSSNDECTRPGDIAGPHYRSTCTLQSLERLRELCRIPPEIMAEAQIASPTESPENHRDGYFCVYEIYFKGCGLTFPLPEALILYLAALEIALPQLTPNLLRTILGIITVAAEAGYVIGVAELNELLSVRSSSKKTGYFSAYPNANRNIISHLPNKDENWHHPWFLIKKTPASIGNLADFLPSKWSAKPGETFWNSFTLERFLEANHRLRMSPPGHLHQIPPPPSTQGMSSRALAAKRKLLSKPMAEACEEKKKFLATSIDKKDYSRTLLVDDGSTEGARFVASFRLTPRRDRRDSRSPRRREKSRARTDRSPRSSPPPEPMGPPRPVDMSSSSQPDSGKTARSASPKKGDSESRDASSRLKPALVPQVKSLSAMETEGSVFRCFKTRSGSILPDFNKWRPAIRERYLLHAYHSSRAQSEFNDMIEHYEGLVIGREKEIDMWKKKFSALEADLNSSDGSKHDLEDKVDRLTSELAQVKGELQDYYDRNYKLQDELSGVQGRLHESESTADTLNNQLIELDAKYKALAKLRDSELARSASKARKEVKGRGMELIQGAIRFMQTEKARSDLESDIKEHESNLILLDQIHEADFSEEQERTELSTNLSEKRSRLAALPTSVFNPLDFEAFFTESPPISESGLDWAGSSEAEDVVPPVAPTVSEVTPEVGCTAEGGQGASSDQAAAKDANEASTVEPDSEVAAAP